MRIIRKATINRLHKQDESEKIEIDEHSSGGECMQNFMYHLHVAMGKYFNFEEDGLESITTEWDPATDWREDGFKASVVFKLPDIKDLPDR